eukprot:3181365-Pyramimonas_sp.AAC.1
MKPGSSVLPCTPASWASRLTASWRLGWLGHPPLLRTSRGGPAGQSRALHAGRGRQAEKHCQ